VVTPLLRDRNLGFLTLMDGWELRIMYTRPNWGNNMKKAGWFVLLALLAMLFACGRSNAPSGDVIAR
jgi:hypothetical protein